MTDLDHLVERARRAEVRSDAADAYVRELERWARPARAAPLRWLVPGIAAAAVAAIAIAIVWPRAAGPNVPAAAVASAPVRVGDRVAIVADPGTEYRVVAATADETRIAIERGAVTARLWHGAAPHRLSLEGGGVIATATGTVYSLSVGAAGAVVHVDEGTVSVRDRNGTRAVLAGASSAAGPVADPRAARALVDLPAPAARAEPLDDAGAAGEIDAGLAEPAAPPSHTAAAPAPAAESVKERWRRERVLRGQGKLDAALAECAAIADAHDATWSPIALVEAARIELDAASDPERALAAADRLLRDYPTHALAAETRDLRCRALSELGRGAECSTPSPH